MIGHLHLPWQRLSKRCVRTWSSFRERLTTPRFNAEKTEFLLSANELHLLQRQLAALNLDFFQTATKFSRAAGEQPSTFTGRGLEFEELRRYVPGDDLRTIEWRATARSGVPYVRVLREQRRANLHLLVDHGLTMRFATHGQPKITQAVRLAALFTFLAQRSDMNVGCTIIGRNEIAAQLNSLHKNAIDILSAINDAPTPFPAADALQRTNWRTVLETLDANLEPGSNLILLSDFQALDDTHQALMATMAYRHRVQAVRILDPVEFRLPHIGRAVFQDLRNGHRFMADSDDEHQRGVFSAEHAKRLAIQAQLFSRVGVSLQQCLTTDDAFKVFLAGVRHA